MEACGKGVRWKMSCREFAVVLAGGTGQRFGSKKQFFEFLGKPLYQHVLDKVKAIVPEKNVVCVGVDVEGGATRSESVMKGLSLLPSDEGRVVVVEAARPLVRTDQLLRLLNDSHPSTTFVMPLVNTVIGRDSSYYDRDKMYELLTPQAFDLSLLKEAYASGDFLDTTDETRVMFEYHGIKPFLIETDDNLRKITYKADIPILEHQASILGEAGL